MSERTHSRNKSSRTLGTLWSTCDILEILWEENGATVSELTERLDLSESAIYNHLTTLRQREWVASVDDEYRLSLQFVLAGTHVLEQNRLYSIGKPDVEALAERTGETTHLVTEQHHSRIELHTVSPDDRAETLTTAYGTTYFHTTASGKAILAFASASRRRTMLDRHELGRRTANTITDEGTLREELAAARERGYTINDEEEMQGLRAVGAPIRSPDDTVVGALSVSGPTTQLSGERLRTELPEAVRTAANMIEVNIDKASDSQVR